MSRTQWLLSMVAGVVVAGVVVACAPPRAFSPSDDAAVRAALRVQQEAWNRGDLDGFMAGYAKSDDIVFTSGGKLHRGWQDTYDRYDEKYRKHRATMGHLDLEVVAIQSLGADGAIVLGNWKLTPGTAGVFSVALARAKDGWHVVHDHTWAPCPPCPDAGSSDGE